MSSKFTGGPAHGRVLNLSRTPILLRVVLDSGGGVDALNEPGDVVRVDEAITVYRLAAPPTRYHWDGRDRSGRRTGGIGVMAEYEVLPEQPDERILRDNARWADWCRAEFDRLCPEWARGKVSA